MIDESKKNAEQQRRCLLEQAMDEYFDARPQLMRTREQECFLEAGFNAAWEYAKKNIEANELLTDSLMYLSVIGTTPHQMLADKIRSHLYDD